MYKGGLHHLTLCKATFKVQKWDKISPKQEEQLILTNIVTMVIARNKKRIVLLFFICIGAGLFCACASDTEKAEKQYQEGENHKSGNKSF